MQRQNVNEEMQKAKEEGQVPRQENMEEMHGNMQNMHTRYCTINCMWNREPLKVLNDSKSILDSKLLDHCKAPCFIIKTLFLPLNKLGTVK